jgi:DNA topoisomerase-2
MSESIQKLTHVEHILKRPDSYVGPVARVGEQYWVKEGDGFEKKTVIYAPALLKIFDEILVNAIDRNSLYPKQVTSISVNIDKQNGEISIENNGPLGGIAVKEHETEKIWNPELTFGHLLTSTNYDDSQQRVVGGRNGYGAKLTNVYSSKFSIKIKDSENKTTYTQEWTNNMKNCGKPKMRSYAGSTSSVCVTFTPDWSRFGMKDMDDHIFKIFEKRVYDASICTSSNCKIKLQGEALSKIPFNEYAKMHTKSDEICTFTSDRWSVCIAPSEDGFEQVSFVNGICTTKGGTHVDHVAGILASNIIDEMAKKIKLKPQQVKNAFVVFVKSTLVNPTFSSQVKSECTLKPQEFGSKFEPTKKLIKDILKTNVQNELMALSKFKEMKELQKTDGARKSKITGIPKLDDANKAGTTQSGKCTLIVTEGDSAKSLAVAGLSVVGRDYYGVFPLRGKCKNVRDASVKQLTENKEFSDLKKILGLQQGKVYTTLDELRYGRLMIMTDADTDGSHIKGLILNMIHYFWPSLLELNFVVSMVTPIIKATKGSQTMSFYTDSMFRQWYGDGKAGWKIKYYKGLGTSTSAEAREYFKSIEQLTVKFDTDEKTDDSIILAFDKTKADSRKTWLLESTEKQGSELEIPYGKVNRLDITDFVHKDLVNFSLADLRRSIAHVSDGLKPSQRKVMYACFAKNLTNEMKVAQLAAYVSEKTSYHHGEVSLADTIVKLAHNFTGSNNINLLEPCGQFGTRLMGGKDASQTRYIFTKLTKDARKLFDPKDDAVLKYLDDDGKLIEPEYFVPIIPTVLVNGTEGIGTGFSCYVPPFNPTDICENIERAISGQSLKEMKPWFNKFKGRVFKNSDDLWVTEGIWTTTSTGNKIKITELPPGRWTQDYKEHLDTLMEKKVIASYVNNSTTDEVDFTITGYSGKDIIKDFKLQKSFHVSNMHLFHPTSGIKKYKSPEEILVDFVEIRMDVYKKRKEHIVRVLNEKAKKLENMSRFVDAVINERIIVFKRKKNELENEISKSYDKIEDSYDYLLNIKTYQYTREAVEALNEETYKTKDELEKLKKTSHLDMWKMDLKIYKQ